MLSLVGLVRHRAAVLKEGSGEEAPGEEGSGEEGCTEEGPGEIMRAWELSSDLRLKDLDSRARRKDLPGEGGKGWGK